ncbi:hypothetical protein BDV93DRAFT_548975 [Ceratobasidium sp. AG-I]|nr:hypothetical protein BDV93DRAFT_548975 [Ceratobasidium sp. AG-I]
MWTRHNLKFPNLENHFSVEQGQPTTSDCHIPLDSPSVMVMAGATAPSHILLANSHEIFMSSPALGLKYLVSRRVYKLLVRLHHTLQKARETLSHAPLRTDDPARAAVMEQPSSGAAVCVLLGLARLLPTAPRSLGSQQASGTLLPSMDTWVLGSTLDSGLAVYFLGTVNRMVGASGHWVREQKSLGNQQPYQC